MIYGLLHFSQCFLRIHNNAITFMNILTTSTDFLNTCKSNPCPPFSGNKYHRSSNQWPLLLNSYDKLIRSIRIEFIMFAFIESLESVYYDNVLNIWRNIDISSISVNTSMWFYYTLKSPRSSATITFHFNSITWFTLYSTFNGSLVHSWKPAACGKIIYNELTF